MFKRSCLFAHADRSGNKMRANTRGMEFVDEAGFNHPVTQSPCPLVSRKETKSPDEAGFARHLHRSPDKGISVRRVSALPAFSEPLHALCRGAVGKSIGHHPALRLHLKMIVANG